ncbi:FkbM family methyltransferase [Blastococcus sp. CCUG 61487]|uniref:FkbM family methyltransferase n=1 Tax=Blastococcus sp. CCUG 61487 TaxID=1840703 RepID=UPI00201D4555|nr:FkbM family methyltransferase [Blastococcus sp. CCUG 61487]
MPTLLRRALRRATPETLKRELKIARVRLSERIGSTRFSWPALYELDKNLVREAARSPGVFLEVGANDGYNQSNTWYLERHLGWTGVLVEPLPRLAAACRRTRSRSIVFNRALVGPGGPPTIKIIDSNLTSVAEGLQGAAQERRRLQGVKRREVVVPTATMSELIDESGLGRPNLISVDVEGAELAVLSGLDLSRHCPELLLVETDTPDAVLELLTPRMRLRRQMTHHDYLFEAVADFCDDERAGVHAQGGEAVDDSSET